MVKDYRKIVGSKTGGFKLYSELKQDFIIDDIKIGRDKFYSFLRLNKLLVPKTKNYITTTNSKHMFKKYKNLVKDQVPNRPEQLWVSDITYIKTDNGHNYLAIVTDAYSKQIMGYKLDNNTKYHFVQKRWLWLLKTGNNLIKNSYIIQIAVFSIVVLNIQNLPKVMAS
jgi:putative transposase